MRIEIIHHVSLTVTDLDRARQFYREILGLDEIERPAFPFPGAWFQVGGNQQLHLIVHPEGSFRGAKGIDTHDGHVAVRVASYRGALEFLRSKGYREDGGDLDLMKMRVNPRGIAGFPQIYVLDPDRNLIEINAGSVD